MNFITLFNLLLYLLIFTFTVAQEIPSIENTILSNQACFSKGTLVGVVFGCIMATLVVTVILCMVVWYYFSKRKKRNTTRISENGNAPTNNVHCVVAYENEQFKTDEPSDLDRNEIVRISSCVTVDEHKNSDESKIANEKKDECNNRTKDFRSLWTSKKCFSSSDCINSKIRAVNAVTLQSKNYSGFGFSIEGNLTNGIFIKRLSKIGPANASGQINEGDQIISLKINFENIVFEDALTILNYSSPYPITLELDKMNNNRNDSNFINEIGRSAKFHPLFKSASSSNLRRPPSPDNFLNESKSKISSTDSEFEEIKSTVTDVQILILTKTPISNLIEEIPSGVVAMKEIGCIEKLDNIESGWPNLYIDPIFRSRSEERLMDQDFSSPSIRSSYSMSEDIDLFEKNQNPNMNPNKRDSGYNTMLPANHTEDETQIEKEHMDKLLYFQNQLTRQQEELSRLGIDVPTPTFLPISSLDF